MFSIETVCPRRGVAATAALRRGRRLFFARVLRLVPSERLVLLLADRVGDLSARLAEVELQDRFTDVAMRALHDVLAEVCPVEAARVASREDIECAPSSVDLFDDSGVSLGTIDRRERTLDLGGDRFEQHQRRDGALDAVRIIGEETHPLRYVADDVAHGLLSAVVGLRQ